MTANPELDGIGSIKYWLKPQDSRWQTRGEWEGPRKRLDHIQTASGRKHRLRWKQTRGNGCG